MTDTKLENARKLDAEDLLASYRERFHHPQDAIYLCGHSLGLQPKTAAATVQEELERLVNDLSMPGVQIGSNVNGKNLDDASLFPVFEAAAELGAAVFVHPWEMVGRERMPKYWLGWLVGMPAETTLALCSMIFGGVLERLPKLRVLFAHGGGAFPATVGRIAHGFDVRPDL